MRDTVNEADTAPRYARKTFDAVLMQSTVNPYDWKVFHVLKKRPRRACTQTTLHERSCLYHDITVSREGAVCGKKRTIQSPSTLMLLISAISKSEKC